MVCGVGGRRRHEIMPRLGKGRAERIAILSDL